MKNNYHFPFSISDWVCHSGWSYVEHNLKNFNIDKLHFSCICTLRLRIIYYQFFFFTHSSLTNSFSLFFLTDEGDDVLESSEQKDILLSGSSSPSSAHSPEGAPTLLLNQVQQLSPRITPPHLIDSHDDVEHSIPATLIQDTSVER